MRRLVGLALVVAINPVLVAATSTESAASGLNHTLATLLVSQSEQDVRTAARSIYHGDKISVAIQDLAGEILWRRCSQSDQKALDTDTQAWLVKAIGRTQKSKYRGVLTLCRSVKESKVLDYISEAERELPPAGTESFKGGQIDPAAVLSDFTKIFALSQKTAAEMYNLLTPGQTIDAVYDLLGPPSKVESMEVRGFNRGFFILKGHTHNDGIFLTYPQVGVVRFSFQNPEKGWGLDIVAWATEPSGGNSLAVRLATGNAKELNPIVKTLLRATSVDEKTLDIIVQRISATRYVRDFQLAKAIHTLCKVVHKHGNGRYRDVMLDVSKTAEWKAIRSIAADIAEQTAGAPSKTNDSSDESATDEPVEKK